MREIDYYFYCASPFTYLGHNKICDLAERYKVKLNYKPVNLFAIWDISGAVPPGQRPPVRQRLRLIELQRLAHWRGLPIKTAPKHWPVDPALADKVVIALVMEGHDPRYFLGKVLAGVWAHDDDISDEAVLASYLSQVGLDSAPALADAKTDAIARDSRAEHTRRYRRGRGGRAHLCSSWRALLGSGSHRAPGTGAGERPATVQARLSRRVLPTPAAARSGYFS
jgi:2-hydroxychromene-2-carboxylate isomerase